MFDEGSKLDFPFVPEGPRKRCMAETRAPPATKIGVYHNRQRSEKTFGHEGQNQRTALDLPAWENRTEWRQTRDSSGFIHLTSIIPAFRSK